MKTILAAVVGTVGLLATPAVAGTLASKTPSKTPAAKPVAHPVVSDAGIAKSSAAATLAAPIAKPAIADAALAGAISAAAGAEQPSPEILAIPELPVDTSNALTQLPNLENRATVPVKTAKPAKDKPLVMNFGDKYVIGSKRTAARPTEEVQQIVPKGLSQAQVATFVQAHADDVQLCWARIPAAERADSATALLRLSISDAGQVTDIEVDGNVPVAAHKCIADQVSRWQFPAAETSSDIEYGIALRSL